MIAVLICLVLGTLTITAAVAYAATSVHSVLLKQSSIRGQYAADAGVEDVLWSLKQGTQPHTSLPGNLNGMQVTMNTVPKGSYTLVASQSSSGHYTWLSVSSNMTWDAGANAYMYTITCTWSGSGNVALQEVGAKLPVGYNYKLGSAPLGGSLSTNPPSDQLDGDGAHNLTWPLPNISIDPTRTQIFYVTGSGPQWGFSSWAVANRGDVGTVGKLSGTSSVITVTATRPQDGAVTAKIVVDVIRSGSNPPYIIYITSYRIMK